MNELHLALEKIAALDPYKDSEQGTNEWGEADCFNQAQEIARAVLQASAASGSPTFPESQGPELTREQIEANWKIMQPTWQPILDSLTGKAP